MKSAASWEEEQQHLKAAKGLADFANLEPESVESFRKAHPNFVPQSWWEYQPTDLQGVPLPDAQWRIAQILVRSAWDSKFRIPPFEYVLLLTAVFDPAWINADYRPPYAQASDLDDEYPYHRAAEWLTGQGWRAKTCLYCRKRFVAEHPKRKYCTFGTDDPDDGFETTCSAAFCEAYKKAYWAEQKDWINADRRQYWAEHKDRINARRRREYRLEKKRSRAHAKRKNLRQR